MKKLAKIENLLVEVDGGGLNIILGEKCTKCNFWFCTCPLTKEESDWIEKNIPKGKY